MTVSDLLAGKQKVVRAGLSFLAVEHFSVEMSDGDMIIIWFEAYVIVNLTDSYYMLILYIDSQLFSCFSMHSNSHAVDGHVYQW